MSLKLRRKKMLAMNLAKINKELTYYVVEPTNKVLGEDGEYIVGHKDEVKGYAIRNTETEVIEATTLMLPTAIFQADYLDKALVSLFEKETLTPPEVSADDVLIN
jgi:hypothetical protein